MTHSDPEWATHRTAPAVWWRLAGFGVLVVCGLVLWAFVPGFDRDSVRSAIEEPGVWAPVGFAAAYIVATVVFLPKNVLSIAAGLIFGLPAGALLVWASAMVGAGMAFWIGRLLGRDGVARLAGHHLRRLDRLVQRHGVAAVLVVRLIPVIPFTVVNYGSALTAVRFPAYLLATALGIVPGTITHVAVGAYGTRPTSWQFLLAAGVLMALSVAGVAYGWARRRRPAGTDEADV